MAELVFDPEKVEKGNRFVRLCAARHTSKTAIARAAGLGMPAITHWETRGPATRTPRWKEVAKELGVSKAALTDWVDEGTKAFVDFIRAELAAFERLSPDEQEARAKHLGWWRDQGKPRHSRG